MKEKSDLMTFMDHVYELRGRLFWVALWFIVVSAAVFPFFSTIIKLLMRPLGNEKLYYLTPIGGLGFIIKISLYLGAIATMPILIYHLYRFISPIVRNHSAKRGILYIVISSLLAMAGILFAYLVSLPSAIHFLTHINIAGVSPMLTVDSYLSFIIAYLLAGAILFQLPLIMIIIDTIKPTPPRQWLKYERHMVVAAFVIGMLVTPTPNVIDQVIMAVPIILMYQIGIGVIYFRHRTKRGHARMTESQKGKYNPAPINMTAANAPTASSSVIRQTRTLPKLEVPPPRRPSVIRPRPTPRRSIDGVSVI